MASRHSSSVAIPRVGESGPRLLRLRADDRLATVFQDARTGEAGRIVVRSREAVTVGEAVTVEISFGALTDEVELAGHVEFVEPWPDGARQITIRIHSEHHERAAYIRKVLAGDRRASVRSHRRVPTDLPASWRSRGHRVASRVRDLSRGGAFIVSRNLPDLGEVVWVEIGLPSAPLHVEGTVSWVRAQGRDAGFGVSFKVRDRDLAAALHRAVREHERTTESR